MAWDPNDEYSYAGMTKKAAENGGVHNYQKNIYKNGYYDGYEDAKNELEDENDCKTAAIILFFAGMATAYIAKKLATKLVPTSVKEKVCELGSSAKTKVLNCIKCKDDDISDIEFDNEISNENNEDEEE